MRRKELIKQKYAALQKQTKLKGIFCFCSKEMQQRRIWRAKQNKRNIPNGK